MMTLQEYLQLKNGTDVRGVATEGVPGEEVNLTAEAAENLAAAFCTFIKKRTGKEKIRVAVGHDSRLSAADLSESVVRGIVKSSGPTPSLYTVSARKWNPGATPPLPSRALSPVSSRIAAFSGIPSSDGAGGRIGYAGCLGPPPIASCM